VPRLFGQCGIRTKACPKCEAPVARPAFKTSVTDGRRRVYCSGEAHKISASGEHQLLPARPGDIAFLSLLTGIWQKRRKPTAANLNEVIGTRRYCQDF